MIRWFSMVIAGGLLALPVATIAGSCAGLRAPVEGAIDRRFEPTGRFSGHWGVDWTVPAGTEVRSAAWGMVTFAGTVAFNQSVTVDHGGGLRTSYSYLSDIRVKRRDRVGPSTVLGLSGSGHGAPVLHFSVRVGDTYMDPLRFLDCGGTIPPEALRLVPARESR